MSVSIHPSAVVDSQARLGVDVRIGPFCLVGPDTELGDGVELHSHVVITGRTRLGGGSVVFPFASLGHRPQDLKYHGEPSELVIGARNQIREYVTIQPGTEGGGMLTQVGDDCLFMASAHVAHDCKVGNHVILANNATLGGHVEIGDHAFLGGISAVHQFVRVGAHAMIGGMSGVEADVIPFGLVMGDRARLSGLNIVGMERRGFTRDEIRDLRAAYKDLFHGGGVLAQRIERVGIAHPQSRVVTMVLDFIRARERRALCLPAENGA
jgi:UDP-N-acetylglucosamine acyltransferase